MKSSKIGMSSLGQWLVNLNNFNPLIYSVYINLKCIINEDLCVWVYVTVVNHTHKLIKL